MCWEEGVIWPGRRLLYADKPKYRKACAFKKKTAIAILGISYARLYLDYHCFQPQDTTHYQGYHILCYIEASLYFAIGYKTIIGISYNRLYKASIYPVIGYHTILGISYGRLYRSVDASRQRIHHNTWDIICQKILGYHCI